jgi:hypothetical protein
VFGSGSDDIVSPSYGPDFAHVFERCAAPAPAGGDGGGDGGGGGGGGGGPTPTGPGGPGETPKDRTAPVISKATVRNRRFAVAAGSTAVAARKPRTPRGTTFAFKLSEKASTTIAITQKLAGRRSGARCVAPRKGLKRTCTRIVKRITLTRAGTRAGTNKLAFTGRAGKTTLKPGSYLAQLTARDPAGNRSKGVTVAFTVVK